MERTATGRLYVGNLNYETTEDVLYNYFCAGSGGVGDTILATSYMLCGEDVVCWDKGEKVVTRPTQRKVVDFGKKCGKREVFLYNLPEVASAREVWGEIGRAHV